MLSDDITGTLSKGISMAGAVIGGALRGALIGAALIIGAAAIASGVGAVGVASAAAVAHGLAGVGLIGGTGAFLGGAVNGVAAMFGIGTGAGAALGGTSLTMGTALTATAAKIGAVVLGATSVIPGTSEWFGLKGLFRRREQTPVYTAPPEPERHISLVRDVNFGDNHMYKPGYGTESMNRGNASSQTRTIC